MERVVLAYSGGLDTSVCIPWLREEKDLAVIAFAAGLGQQVDLDSEIYGGPPKCERLLAVPGDSSQAQAVPGTHGVESGVVEVLIDHV